MLFPQILSQGIKTEKSRILTEFWLWSLAGIELKRGVKSVSLHGFHLQWVIMDCSVWFEYQLPLQLKPSISVSVWGFLWAWFCTRRAPSHCWHQGPTAQAEPPSNKTVIRAGFVRAQPASKTPLKSFSGWCLQSSCLRLCSGCAFSDHWAVQEKCVRQRCLVLWVTSRCFTCCFGRVTVTAWG